MTTISASTVAFLPLSWPVKGLGKFTHSYPLRVSMACDGRRVQSKALLSEEPLCIGRRKPATHSIRMQPASIVCAAAITCSAEQTQTVTHKAPTITHVPGKEKGPQLADGGGGFPPRDDGGGGGGGGGGENFSGGFFFFGFLAFLGFLKELDKDNKRDRR